MVKYILLGLIVLSPLNRMNGEDFPFFPIGAWGVHGGKDNDSQILRASGINLLISGWGYPDKADYWDQAAKNDGLKLNVQWPKPGTPYYSAGEYYYECTQTLLDNYPVHIDEDSLAFWENLKEILISAIANSYTSDSFSIFCTSLSFYNHQTRPLHVPGIRAMCDGANPNGRSLGYITWKWFLPLVKPYLQVNTCIINKSKPDSMNPGNGDYNDLLQSQFNELIEKDTEMQTAHDSAGIEFWPQLVLQRDKKNPPAYRHPTEAELRTETFLTLAYGAKGLTYFFYRDNPPGWPDAGLVDSVGRPYMPDDLDLKDSIFGSSGGGIVTNTSSSIFSDFWRVGRDLRNLGPAFRAVDWDTATSITGYKPWCTWTDGLENSRCKISKVDWLNPTNINSNILYGELALFSGDVPDPIPQIPTKWLRRDYVSLVNRHCVEGDSVELLFGLINKDPQHRPTRVVDMRHYMFKALADSFNTWDVNHQAWTHYKDNWSDWDETLPQLKPGEGRLFAIVGDNYLWNILGRITYYSIGKYNDTIGLHIKTWARGELFRNGPRRRDVGFVRTKIYKLSMTYPANYPKLLSFPMQKVEYVKIKPKATVNSIFQKSLVFQKDDSVSHMSFDWPDDFPMSNPDSAWMDEWDLLLPRANYEINIEVYNRLGEYMGCPIFCINGKPSATSKFSKMTAYPCGKKVVDPEGVFHMVYTGGTNIPVVLYAKFNPKDTVQAVPESLYTGTYPTPETLGIGKYPTIVVKHGDTKDIVGVAWLSLDASKIYFSVKADSQWRGPYVLCDAYNSNYLSIPRMALGLNDTVYYTYAKKRENLPNQLQLICGKFPLLNFTSPLADEVSEWENTGNISDPIDSLGAAISVDYNGCPHLAWLENDTIVRYGMARFGGFAVITLAKVRYRGGLGEPVCIINNFPNANVCVAWPQSNILIRSCFYVEDTVEIFRDTVRVGEDTIKQISAKDGFVSWKENTHLFVGLWDAVNRTWSPPETLDTDSLEGFYTQTEANQFINSANNISPARYVIWTARVNDTLYWLTGSIKKYAGNGEYGVMPAAYLKLGQPQSTPFTVYRDSTLSFGNEDYKHVDIGYDSLVYHLPFVKPNDKGRIFIESYFDSGDTTGSCLFRLVVNGRIIKDSIAIYSRQLSRTTEFLPPEVMQAGQLTIKLIKLRGDYVPCSRIILTTFELDLTGRTGGGQQSQKLQTLPKTFILYQNMPNPFSKVTVIRYGLPVKTRVSLKIYDVMGRQVKKLVSGEQQPGFYAVNWDGKDDQNRSLASGVYFYRLETKEYKSTKKVVQLR